MIRKSASPPKQRVAVQIAYQAAAAQTLATRGATMYSEHKAAQMCAFFLSKVEGGKMSHLKLMKLLYLADRESYRRHGHGISGDAMVSMPYGPALSQTLNHINGHTQSAPGGWDDWIADKADHQVQLKKKNITRRDLKEMSECDMDVMAAVWEKFGGMDWRTISDYTHTHCAEWEDPNGSSKPIDYETILRAVGYSAKHAGEIAAVRREEEAIDMILQRPA